MLIENKIEELITPVADDMGLDIVKISKSGENLLIMIERKDRESLAIDDCGKFSTAVGAILDVEELISDNYTLEVSSAGMDRPLVKIADFTRFIRHAIKAELKFPIDGETFKKFKGIVKSVDGDKITFIKEKDDLEFSVDIYDIKKCNIEITEEMIRELLNKNKVSE